MDTPSEPALAFPPKGALRRFAFPKLVREIARGKVTGSLYLLNGQTKKVVFFEEGQPVFVRSNVLSECLGQVLSTEGLITQEQCEQTLEAIRRTGKKQGELLVEMGILSEGNLRYGLAAQLRSKLYDIFAWDDGRYQFKADVPGNQLGVRLDARPEAVIIGAILDRYDEERAEKLLGPSMEQYLVYGEDAPLDVGDLDLLPEERYFVECIDGSRTVAQCVRDELAQSVPNPHALVYGLVQAGVAELADAALESRPRPAQPNYDERPADGELQPGFDPQNVVTEYEDTPLPGELPKMRGLLGEHEDDFADVEALQTGTSVSPFPSSTGDVESGAPSNTTPQVSEELVAAEPDQVEETFDESVLREDSGPKLTDVDSTEIELELDESASSELPDEPPLVSDLEPEPAPTPTETETEVDADELVDPLAGLDLDDLDIEPEPEPEPDPSPEPEPVLEDVAPETVLKPVLDDEPELLAGDDEQDPEPPPDLTALEPELEPALEPALEPEPDPASVMDDLLEADDGVVELDDLDDIEELDVDGIDALDEGEDAEVEAIPVVEDELPAEPPLVDLDAEPPAELEPELPPDMDPGATRADPLPPLAVNRDLGAATPLEPDPEPELELEPDLADDDLDPLDSEAALDDFDVDDDLLLGDGGGDDMLPVDELDELDDIDLGDAEALTADDDLAMDELDPEAPLDDEGDSLVGLDELDDVDLAGAEAPSPAASYTSGPEATFQESQDPEMVGAMRFNEAETALGEQRFPDAVALLEDAYDNGFDVAELHAMLAFARFNAAGQDLETAQHAFELLEYAESMDPSLDLVWAYRGSIHHALGDDGQARSTLQRALELNPYCELAIQIMDTL